MLTLTADFPGCGGCLQSKMAIIREYGSITHSIAPVKDPNGDYRSAEILGSKEIRGRGDTPATTRYYVHYVEWNKRLDEWVDADRIDFSKITPPKKVSWHRCL